MDKKEQEIIISCQKGDKEKFGLIYDRYVKKIYDFIYYKTLNKDIAEDLTSTAFIKALKNIKNFQVIEGNFSAWLYRIAKNSVSDYYRSKKNDINIEDVWGLDSGEDIEHDIDIKKKLTDVESYLRCLDKDQRDIIIMRVWQGLSYKEISEILGKSEAGCKMSFSRTISRLKKEMPLAVFILFMLYSCL